MKKIVVVFSGGMDSATLLWHLAAAGNALKAVTFNYGQRHVRELDAASALCARLGVEHVTVDLTSITPLLGENSLSGRSVEVPEGHYEEESMKLTIVPNRNMIMLSIAIGWALSNQYEAVAYGAHSGDHAIYPDCRPEFAAAMDQAARLCDWREIELMRPFVHLDKGDIARIGHELGVPFELTWTCYKGGDRHCGRCGACQERREAFGKHGIADPVEYA
ncbi:MAG: 7-cyano-7-deazaguanine synthase QueC [Planctomycetales bacterium]|nr:7-cyano-7-deazaguanine synthase QueC [Planctomycetales bacterium]